MTDTGANVSVVIPAYHAERFIARAIQSVLDQPGIEPEIIVVVDGLFDRTAEIAKAFPKTQVVIHEVNRGAPVARNRGLALATAPYVMFLDADDWVEGPLLQGLVEALGKFGADIAFGPCVREYESGQPSILTSLCTEKDNRHLESNNQQLLIRLLTGAFIHPCSTMWRTTYVVDQGGWNENLVRFQDFEITYRCLIRGAKVILSEKGRGTYYQHVTQHRITTKIYRERWKSELLAINLVINEAKMRNFFDNTLQDAFIYYVGCHMRTLARLADSDIYLESKKMFEELGGKQLDGTFLHRLGCAVLGLRGKERLALKISNLKKNRSY